MFALSANVTSSMLYQVQIPKFSDKHWYKINKLLVAKSTNKLNKNYLQEDILNLYLSLRTKLNLFRLPIKISESVNSSPIKPT